MKKEKKKVMTAPPPVVEQTGTEEMAKTPPGYAYIKNLMPMEFGVDLTDGTHLSAGPKRGHNKSRSVAKKLLPPHVRRMAKQRKIEIVEGGAK